MSASSTDSDLIVRSVQHDDRSAFGELVLRHQSAVRRFLRQLTHGDTAWADDLAQETFLQAHRSLARFRGEASFTTWLLGIAHNQFRNARRRQRETPTDTHALATEHATPSEVLTSDMKNDLANALRSLTEDEQTALHVCYQQGLSHGEAASVLGWPIGTVKTHLARGKDKLRQLLHAWNPNA